MVLNRILPFTLLVFLFACNKEEQLSPPPVTYSGNMDYLQETTHFNHSELYAEGDVETVDSSTAYVYQVILYDKDFKFTTSNGEITGVVGTGDVLFLELYSSSSGVPEPRTYNINTDSIIVKDGNAGVVGAIINTSLTNNNPGTAVSIQLGTITILEVNRISISLEFTGTDYNGESITGSYHGNTSFYNPFDARYLKKPSNHHLISPKTDLK